MQVETHGKGKDFTSIQAVTSQHTIAEYRDKFSIQFKEYTKHIVPSWHLSNTKLEIMRPLERRRHQIFAVSDFPQNVLIIRKHELADQYFHRPEILVFGCVVSFLVKDGNTGLYRLHTTSYIVSSDYRWG